MSKCPSGLIRPIQFGSNAGRVSWGTPTHTAPESWLYSLLPVYHILRQMSHEVVAIAVTHKNLICI